MWKTKLWTTGPSFELTEASVLSETYLLTLTYLLIYTYIVKFMKKHNFIWTAPIFIACTSIIAELTNHRYIWQVRMWKKEEDTKMFGCILRSESQIFIYK